MQDTICLPSQESEFLKTQFAEWPLKLRAKSVLQLSDYYIDNPSAPTPWAKEFCRIAYFSYFHPLNLLRCAAAIQRCPEFFEEIDFVHDYGCGLGAASKAIHHYFPNKKFFAYDVSPIAMRLSQLKTQIGAKTPEGPPRPLGKNDLLITSFALTEIESLPRWVLNFKSVLFVEPALRHDGGLMQNNRQYLIEKGYHMWSPCTHQLSCPMREAKRDWCHDKVQPTYPDWLTELIAELPMRNRSLAYSYLAAKRTAPAQAEHIARMVGDPLVEKGKTRQMICFNEKRNFVSWLHREQKPTPPRRGDLVYWSSENNSKTAKEIRLQENLKVLDPLDSC